MDNTQIPITLEEAIFLKKRFDDIFDENLKPKDKTVFSKEVKQFYDIINSERVGIPKGTAPKQIGIKLEEWFETLSQTAETSTELPEYKAQNTTVTPGLDEKIEDYEKIRKQKAEIKEKEKQTVEDFIKQNQERIDKAKLVQDKLKDKVLYAKVILPEPLPLDEIEQKDLTTLREYAQGDEATRTKLIDDLAKQIETKLENIPEEQKVLIARTAAVEIVEKIAKPEVAIETQIQAAILTAIHDDKTKVLPTILQKDDDLLIAAKNGATLISLESRNKELTTEVIIKNLFGPKLTVAINGYSSEQIQIILSESKFEGQNARQVELGNLNLNYIQQLQRNNSILDSVKEFSIDRTQNYFTNQAKAYLAEKMTGLPAGNVIKKTYSSPLTQTILARYGLANPVVWETVGQSSQLVGFLMKVAPETAGPVLSFVGKVSGSEIVAPIVTFSGGIAIGRWATQTAATATAIADTGGIMASEAFLGGAGQAASQTAVKTGLLATTGSLIAKGAAAIGVSLGVFTAGLSTAITAAFYAVGKLINWPKVKKWFRDNKEVLVGITAGVGLLIGGPAVGGIVLLGGLAATGSIGAFASGTLGVLGFIGSSIGIAIATPVIITILIIPPLIEFIMLVINNSAYVVPPSLTEFGIGRITSPYIDITKTASPAGPLTNSNLPIEITYTVTIKAKKSALTNVKITDTCQVISRDNIPCPTFTIPSAPTSISPTAPYVFTYTANLDTRYNDSVVINTIIVTADTVGQNGTTAEMSNSLTIGNPPISCPVPGAKPLNSMNYSYNSGNNSGHGSTAYWDAMGSRYSYALPQSTGCMKPGDCPYYGYAYDVFPNGTTEVFAPSVLGKDVNWNCSYAFSNGGGRAGHTYHCTSTGNNYLLVLTHMKNGAKTGFVKSGEKIGTLYNQGTNTHLHLEFQLGGKWEKPENYFCK